MHPLLVESILPGDGFVLLSLLPHCVCAAQPPKLSQQCLSWSIPQLQQLREEIRELVWALRQLCWPGEFDVPLVMRQLIYGADPLQPEGSCRAFATSTRVPGGVPAGKGVRSWVTLKV